MPRLILTGMALIDGTGKPPVPDASLVIDGGRIDSIGQVTPRPGDQVITIRGGTVLPGLIDAHVHLLSHAGPGRQDVHLWNVITPIEEQTLHAAANAQRALRSGVTTLRDTAGSWPEVSVRRAIDAGILPGPRILASGMVGMTAGHADMFAPAALRDRPWPTADGVDECRKRVREYARMGVDLIKICTSGGTLSIGDRTEWRNYTEAEVHTIVDEAHALGLSVAAHAHTATGIRVALEAGVDTLEHGSGLDAELIELMLRTGAALCPTLSISEHMLSNGRARGLPEATMAKAERLAPVRRAAVQAAYRAGVPIIAGTDSSNTLPFGNHARELQLLHEIVGMSPLEAIGSATSGAAKALGIGDETGSLEPGKAADVLIVRGDPLTDLTILRDHLVTVLRAGVPVDPSTLGDFVC